MQITLDSDQTYVVAVSGGVDSVVLLDLLAGRAGVRLIVAHFDHGVRAASVEDAVFVQQLAVGYDLEFAGDRVELGSGASEAACRQARYDFLYQVVDDYDAHSLVTAHHLDDFLETVVMNFSARQSPPGSGWPAIDRQVAPAVAENP